MALSSSGSISLQSIEGEFGGSSPISLSEYYSGSIAGNTTSLTITPTINGASSTYQVNYGTALKPNYYNQIVNNFGFMDSSIASSSNPNVGQGSYTTSAIRSGVDKTGNAGAIPSSGTISFDHFRGTDAGKLQQKSYMESLTIRYTILTIRYLVHTLEFGFKVIYELTAKPMYLGMVCLLPAWY